jgi:hypothetical protein
MATRKVTSVAELAGILRTIFLLGKTEKLPLRITDPHGKFICEIEKNDPSRWVKTPYADSFACTKQLCTKQEWDRMSMAKQFELCDCWEALAIFEYLHVSYDAGHRFQIEDYEC